MNLTSNWFSFSAAILLSQQSSFAKTDKTVYGGGTAPHFSLYLRFSRNTAVTEEISAMNSVCKIGRALATENCKRRSRKILLNTARGTLVEVREARKGFLFRKVVSYCLRLEVVADFSANRTLAS